MAREQIKQEIFESDGLDLQSKFEKLMSWAKTHAELGTDLIEPHSEDEHEALRRCFARSLELGREIIGSCEQSLKARVRSEGTSPRLDPPRKDLILPLSGSMRFVDPGVGFSLSQPLCDETSTRRIPLSPSRSYSKKKAF